MNSWWHIQTNRGETLKELSDDSKVMLVFLRHFGCTFCREALADIHSKKEEIESEGTTIVLVHQIRDNQADEILKLYHLENVHRISDPNLEIYHAFNLHRASFRQHYGLRVWLRVFVAGLLKGHMLGPEQGDGWQMPGIFIIKEGKIIDRYIHDYVSDRPDYVELSACEINAAIHT